MSAASRISEKLQMKVDAHVSEQKDLSRSSRNPPLNRLSVSRVPSSPNKSTNDSRDINTDSIQLEANNQLLKEVIAHLAEERNALHEQALHFEVDRFRDQTSEKAIQRQLEMLQFQIRDHQMKVEQQVQIDQLHETQHKRRREKLQRMIDELQSELQAELLAESQYQAFKLRQQKESLEMQKKWDEELKKIKGRIQRSNEPRERDRVEQEKSNSNRMAKIQSLYKATVQQQNQNQLGRPLPKTPSYQPAIKTRPIMSRTTESIPQEKSRDSLLNPKPEPTFSEDSPLAKAFVVSFPTITLYGCMPSNSAA